MVMRAALYRPAQPAGENPTVMSSVGMAIAHANRQDVVTPDDCVRDLPAREAFGLTLI
jgi:hypothetical protein